MRFVWDPETGKWSEKKRRVVRPGRAPMIQASFGNVFSHVDGRTYTSRREWNRHLNAHGMVELGNERVKPKPFEPEGVEQSIADAYEELSK